ncbi:hypothetical protein N0V90_002011 [Kalmusia sp. IMI 367209]|nr:hypothetical protein N0V90_002011 [Kalmusia sp. IMI 367209]
MALPGLQRETVNDLWARAAAQLTDNDKKNLNFSVPDKLNILADLHAEAEKSKQRSIQSRWKYTRKNGQTVILRDVFAKLVWWIDKFKQIGDVAVQYDTAHASLPWAAIRFILQITVNDVNTFASVIEGLPRIAELIYRFAITEALYIQGTSDVVKELERALVKLYVNILGYLSKAKQYLDQGTANNINNHIDLMHLLKDIDAPLRRMDDDLKNIHDNLKSSKRTKILQWLSNEPYRQYHNQAKEGVLAGTGQWLLSDPIFKQWKDESASSILWLHGIPGSGKTKLVSIVIEDALKNFEHGNSPLPVFFYCSRNPAEPMRSNPKQILASLARQLSCVSPGEPLLNPTFEIYQKREEEGFASGSLEIDESCTLIRQLVELYPVTTIIIDAMDECDPQKRSKFLKAIEQILRDSCSLVKILISSRNDEDITIRLQDYPNLEIESRRNGDDIVRFVESRTQQLIDDKELLRHSRSPRKVQELIVSKVIKGASGMFRWADMQLQFLCSIGHDADIEENLGRLPPNLQALYAEIYDLLITIPGDFDKIILQNVLRWLLCAKKKLETNQFLAVIAVNLQTGKYMGEISKEMVLRICANFVVFDSQLNTFRFAHLSVREFLEQRPEYSISASNGLAANFCCWSLLFKGPDFVNIGLAAELRWDTDAMEPVFEKFREYADIYWAEHCKFAGEERKSGPLNMALDQLLLNENEYDSPIRQWNDRFGYYSSVRRRSRQLEDAIAASGSTAPIGFFVCCAFDFIERLDIMTPNYILTTPDKNDRFQIPLQIAATFGSLKVLVHLLVQFKDNVEITKTILSAAVSGGSSGEEVMSILLDHRGGDIQVTNELVDEIADNAVEDEEIISLLLRKKGEEVLFAEGVTEILICYFHEQLLEALKSWRKIGISVLEVVMRESAHSDNGEEVITFLFDRHGAEARALVTEDILEAAAGNWMQGDQIMARFLEQQDLPITEQVIKAAAGNKRQGEKIIARFLEQRDITITEEVIKIATAEGNWTIIGVLLKNKRVTEVPITGETLEAVLKDRNTGKRVTFVAVNLLGWEEKLDNHQIMLQWWEEVSKSGGLSNVENGANKIMMYGLRVGEDWVLYRR